MKSPTPSVSTNAIGIFLAFVLLLLPHSAFAQSPATTDISGPTGSGAFGTLVHTLPNGNIVIVDPLYDSASAEDVGAVSLYDGATRELISRLTGDKRGDMVGGFSLHPGNPDEPLEGRITDLGNGNFVVTSVHWHKNSGAVTWVNGETGLSGVISAANSLVGESDSFDAGINSDDGFQCPTDSVGSDGITVLPSHNYVVLSQYWSCYDGAATWGSGTQGVAGEISATNSIIGGRPENITMLTNGNYVIQSTSWSGVKGAATWVNGSTGKPVGEISAANSLVGSKGTDRFNGDMVGLVVVPLTNGNYVVGSQYWDNGSVADAGAATWGNGATGTVGVVSPANSLVGSRAGDNVGSYYTMFLNGAVDRNNSWEYRPSIVPLANGNYVVITSWWDSLAAADVGAVTWANGETGIKGPISASNSLVGSRGSDVVGNMGVMTLVNGNYVVLSSNWQNGESPGIGAITWADGETGIKGTISEANSLVARSNESIAPSAFLELPDGNFVVASNSYVNGGAVTWFDGNAGRTGYISEQTSLVGSDTSSGAWIGGSLFLLDDGNYVVVSPYWSDAEGHLSAVTWGNGATGTAGIVSPANSLVSTMEGGMIGYLEEDWISRVVPLTNGNYVVVSPAWNDGEKTQVGAITLGKSGGGTVGPVTSDNSLLGNVAGEQAGRDGVFALTNGNYVVASSRWGDVDSGLEEVGAVTWGDGVNGTTGYIGAANSMIGGNAFDHVGSGGITPLANGNYLFHSPEWQNGAIYAAGATTWARGDRKSTGVVSTSNSLVGGSMEDRVGLTLEFTSPGYINVKRPSAIALENGDFVLLSYEWDNPAVSAASGESTLAATNAGAITWGNGSTGSSGVISANNSVLGKSEEQGKWLYVFTTAGKNTFFAGMAKDQKVVVFGTDPQPARLTVQLAGTGKVTSAPAGINCGATCVSTFANGTVVTLTATADPGAIFTGWSGACTGSGTCSVTMNGSKSVTATFAFDGANASYTFLPTISR